MTFVTSGLAIAGLCAVAIPILIHLLARQRRKPIQWAAMRFLIEAFKKHRRRLQLEQLILLAVRCLILALLGVALARPILESAGLISAGGSRAVYLVIDDGMAAGVTGEDHRTALQHHVKQAVDLVKSLGPGDAIGLITAARPAKGLLVPPSTDHSAAIDLLQALAPKESPTDLPGAFNFVRTAVDESKKSRQQTLVYLFSEFRNGSAALDSPLPSTHANPADEVKLIASPPAAQPVSNVQVISIEPVRSMIIPGANDGSGQITVRLKRSGGQLVGDVTRVRLAGDGLPAPEPKVVQWQPGQAEADVDFMLNIGSASDRQIGVTASIDDDNLNADNQRHTVLEMRSQIRVLLIDRRSFGFERTLDKLSAGQWIRRALEPLEKSPIQIVEAEPAAIDLADIRTADVAIVPRPDLLSDAGWAILRQFTQQDGLLILMPPGDVNVHQWTEHLPKDLNLPWRLALEVVEHKDGLGLAEEQPSAELMRLISSDLAELASPVITTRVLPVDKEQTQAQALLNFTDGSPMVIAGSPNEASSQVMPQRLMPRPPPSPPALPNLDAQRQARGLVIYLAVAPETSWTNLPTKPLMVPLFHEMIRQGLSVIRAAQRVNVGEQPSLARGASARDLIGPQGQKITIDSSGRPQQPFEHAGVYGVLDQSDQPIGKLAVNVDPIAGGTEVQSTTAVSSWLANSGPWNTFDASNISASLGGGTTGSPIAGIILMIVLLLVVLETVLARWFSHAYREQGIDSRHQGSMTFSRGSPLGASMTSSTSAAGGGSGGGGGA